MPVVEGSCQTSESELQRRTRVLSAGNDLFSILFSNLQTSIDQTLYIIDGAGHTALGLKARVVGDNSRARRYLGLARKSVDVVDFGQREMDGDRVKDSLLQPETGCLFRTKNKSGIPEVGLIPCQQSQAVSHIPSAARALLLWEISGVTTDEEGRLSTTGAAMNPWVSPEERSNNLGTLNLLSSVAEASAKIGELRALRIKAN